MILNINIFSLFGRKKKDPYVSGIKDLYKHCSQTKPLKHYVYAHLYKGEPFYIGKGQYKRAWSDKRNPYWNFYTQNMLDGPYEVLIMKDGLTENEAERLEAEIMAKFSGKLLNIIDMARSVDLNLIEKQIQITNKRKILFEAGKEIENADGKTAVKKYLLAIEQEKKLLKIDVETGLMSEVINKRNEVLGHSGYIELINRLTICLKKMGLLDDAKTYSIDYFKTFRYDLTLSAAQSVLKRVGLDADEFY